MFGLAVGLAARLSARLEVEPTVRFVAGLSWEPAAGLTVGLVVGLTVGFVVGRVFDEVVGFGPALQTAIVEKIWRLRFQRVRFLPLLQVALDRQVLRQAGAVYQFRHAALQDHLASLEATPPSTIDVSDTIRANSSSD